jgi:hypothetical protein
MTCDYKHAALMYGAPEFIRLGAWVKANPMPQISADRPGQGFETVLILPRRSPTRITPALYANPESSMTIFQQSANLA